MAQRILEPGQIESLDEASIPRIRLPDRAFVFARRAERLRGSQDPRRSAIISSFSRRWWMRSMPRSRSDRGGAREGAYRTVGEHAMPPSTPRPGRDRPNGVKRSSPCARRSPHRRIPFGCWRGHRVIRGAASAWIETQATSILKPRARRSRRRSRRSSWRRCRCTGSRLRATSRRGGQAPRCPGGVSPCGTLPVASIVYAHAPFQGYRYLHCALCATEWHMVRVQCSQCGASGKSIGYHSLESDRRRQS